MKIVGDKKYGDLLGGHIVGAKATELIQELVNVRALEEQLPRGRAHRPWPSDAVGGRDGGGARRGRMADPRLTVVAAGGARAAAPRAPAQRPVFYYDLASPEAYLAAERVNAVLPMVPEWQPILLAELEGAEDLEAWR